MLYILNLKIPCTLNKILTEHNQYPPHLPFFLFIYLICSPFYMPTHIEKIEWQAANIAPRRFVKNDICYVQKYTFRCYLSSQQKKKKKRKRTGLFLARSVLQGRRPIEILIAQLSAMHRSPCR